MIHARRRAAMGTAAVAAAVLGSVALPAYAADSGPTTETVVSGLNNPRQLALRPGGALVIAEAGRGGAACNQDGCVGNTASVTQVAAPATTTGASPTRIITGLPSAAAPDGAFAVGADGVAVQGAQRTFVSMTYAPPDLLPGGAPPGDTLGKLLLQGPSGNLQQLADLAAYEAANDPDHNGVDSNPYGMTFLRGSAYIADAGGNSLVAVPLVKPDKGSGVRLVTTFARRVVTFTDEQGNEVTAPRDPVPTSVTVGPDGMLYVGELGPGEVPGQARVWRVDPQTGNKTVYADGLTSVVGLAFGPEGSLYVSELFGGGEAGPPGQLVKITRAGSRSTLAVPLPGGVAVAASGTVYVAAWSVSDADGAELFPGFTAPPGEVLRVTGF